MQVELENELVQKQREFDASTIETDREINRLTGLVNHGTHELQQRVHELECLKRDMQAERESKLTLKQQNVALEQQLQAEREQNAILRSQLNGAGIQPASARGPAAAPAASDAYSGQVQTPPEDSYANRKGGRPPRK